MPPSGTVKGMRLLTVRGESFKVPSRPADAQAMTTDITVGEYVPRVRANLTPGTLEAWRRILALIEELWGDRRPADIEVSDVAELVRIAQETAVRRWHYQGRGAAEHAVAASRHLLGAALRDDLVQKNVALLVPRPGRADPSRSALSRRQVDELLTVAAAHDERTLWMLRWLLETGSRREGLLDLEPGVLRSSTRTVLIVEKGRKSRVLPVSASLAAELARPSSTLYGWTKKRLEGDWKVLRDVTGWAGEMKVSSHWLRHTAVTRMERASSFVVAARWAGHSLSSVVTSTYVRVGLPDVACGWSSMTGELHPLHDCEESTHCFVQAHRPELLTAPAANDGNLRLLRGIA